jgi:site-specific recombinase XerD
MVTANLSNEQGERLFFNEEDRRAFIRTADSAKDSVRTFCNVLHYTGCNFTEAMILTPRHIDCAGKAIIFQDDDVSRAVPVPASLIELLDAVHGIRLAQTGIQADERLWPYTRKTLFIKVNRVIEEAGITGGPHATPKGIRQGFFVHAIRHRILLTRLQRWMGHSEIDYTAANVAALLRYDPEALGNERADAERVW